MNLLTRLDPGVLVTRLALGALVQSTAVILLAAVVARLALGRRAAARHGLWLGAMAWVLLSPAVVVVGPTAPAAVAETYVPSETDTPAEAVTVRPVVRAHPETARDATRRPAGAGGARRSGEDRAHCGPWVC